MFFTRNGEDCEGVSDFGKLRFITQ